MGTRGSAVSAVRRVREAPPEDPGTGHVRTPGRRGRTERRRSAVTARRGPEQTAGQHGGAVSTATGRATASVVVMASTPLPPVPGRCRAGR